MELRAETLPSQPTLEIDKQLRIETDTSTWLAETLHGSMRTSFEFHYDGNQLRGEDGGLLDDIFDDSISQAKAMTEWNPSMLFELRRRIEERQELDDMYKMAGGELPNTMVVISDFPDELKNSDEDVGGYNVTRQQTMMRIITRGVDGNLKIISQSLDGSNRQALETIYNALGKTPEEGELLSQRIYLDLPEAWQDNLTNNLTKVYDASLTEQLGGEWHAGISQKPDKNIINTYEFVLEQKDLLQWFTKEKLADPINAEKLRYKLAATAKSRLNKYIQKSRALQKIPGEVSYYSVVSAAEIATNSALSYEIERAANISASRGDVFSGCGSSINADESLTDLGLSDLGFGNKSISNSDKSCEFTSKECPECHTKNVKTKVTKTHITGSCGCTKKIK